MKRKSGLYKCAGCGWYFMKDAYSDCWHNLVRLPENESP